MGNARGSVARAAVAAAAALLVMSTGAAAKGVRTRHEAHKATKVKLHAAGSLVALRGADGATVRVRVRAGTTSFLSGYEMQAPPTLSYLVVHVLVVNAGHRPLALSRLRISATDKHGHSFGIDSSVGEAIDPSLPASVRAGGKVTEVVAMLVPVHDPGLRVLVALAGGKPAAYAVRG